MIDQKVAILDLGTNTFNLLLVKITSKAYYIFHNEKVPVMLGKDGITKGIITPDAQQRALVALKYYKEIIDSEKITNIYGYATSAFRDAKNGPAFRDRILEKTGISVTIVSGEDEAAFIYRGVQTAFDIGGENALIMDIGGGSVELIIGNRNKAVWKKSFNIGAQRLLDWFHPVDPMTTRDIEKINLFFDKELKELTEQMDIYKPNCLIGSSGTFDTLSDIYQHHINRFTNGDATEFPLTTGGFEKIYQQIIHLHREERLKIPGMIAMRVDMIVVASCLVKYVIDQFSIESIRVSAHALKEGMISEIQQNMVTSFKLIASNN